MLEDVILIVLRCKWNFEDVVEEGINLVYWEEDVVKLLKMWVDERVYIEVYLFVVSISWMIVLWWN